MPLQLINIGASADDLTGDDLRVGWQKSNANFSELYATAGNAVAMPGLGWFNVKAFGAIGDGATDDTVALQAAMDAAHTVGGGVVYAPGGIYKYSTLRFYSLVTLQGGGVTAGGSAVTTLYQPSAAAPLLQPNDPTVGTKGFCIRDIVFSSFGNVNNTGGLDLTGCALFDIDRVHVSGCNNFGVRVVGIAPAGNSGFGNFSRVLISSLRTGSVAWLFGSNTTLDQPDGLSFWACYTNVASDVVVIRSTGPVGGHGPGSHSWTGCRFELGNAGGPQVVIDVDSTGYGADFVACRFETFGIATVLNLVGVAYSGGISFYRTTLATSGGALTINDTGAIPTQWVGCGTGVGGIGRLSTILPNIAVGVQTVSGNATLNALTTVTLVDASAGAVTISLPDPTVLPAFSVVFRVMKKDSSANAVTISAGARTINGVPNKLLHQQYQCIDVMSDGANWFTVGAHGIAEGVMELMAFSGLNWGDGGPGRGYVQIDGTPKFILSLDNTTRLQCTTAAISPVAAAGLALGTSALPWGALWMSEATMIHTKTSFTNGAAAAAGTLTNAPVAGNPTKWIPIDDNGTTRYIPAW